MMLRLYGIFWSNPADGPVYATHLRSINMGGTGEIISIKGMDITGIKDDG